MHLSNHDRTESKVKRYLSSSNLLVWGLFDYWWCHQEHQCLVDFYKFHLGWIIFGSDPQTSSRLRRLLRFSDSWFYPTLQLRSESGAGAVGGGCLSAPPPQTLLSSQMFKLRVTNELLRSHQTTSRSLSCWNLPASPTTPFSSHVRTGVIGASE